MALVLLLLLSGLVTKHILLYKIAIPVLVINMIVPKAFYPFAVFWFSLANILAKIGSTIIMTLIYFVILSPVALLKRKSLKTSLHLNNFHKSKSSVMKTRNHTFTRNDMEKPF